MAHCRWRRGRGRPAVARSAVAALPVATAVLASLTGCGGSGQAAANATATAGTVAQQGPLTAAKLRGALLTRVNGRTASGAPSAGAYAALPGVKAAQEAEHTGTVLPRACTRAGVTGMANAALAKAPAAAVAFQVGRNTVSETLIAPTPSAARTVLGTTLPKDCARYTVTVGHKTYRYSATESGVTGIGDQARVMSVKVSGEPADTIWSVLYRGTGFIGAIAVVGPNASELAVRELALQAYGFATKTLS